MNAFDVIWAVIALPPILWEAYAIGSKVEGDTLSERTRVWLRTSTIPGRTVFLAAWVGLTVWYPIHILA